MSSFNGVESTSNMEVNEMLVKTSETAIEPDPKMRPLSPILGGSFSHRKFLIGKRLRNMKSRVKLSDRFKEHEEKNNIPDHNLENEILELTEDNFTVSQNDSIVKQLEKLEELEYKRQQVYEVFVASKDFCFKKPTSPAHNKLKKAKYTQNNDNDTIEGEESNYIIDSIDNMHKNISIDLPICSNFQTGTGKSISIKEEDIKKHSRLFDDIVYSSSQNNCKVRKNKYAFLSKSQSDTHLRYNAETSADTHVRSISSESNISVKNTSNNERILNNSEDLKNTLGLKDRPISLTQEICDSGISNTQMLSVFENVSNSIKNDNEAKSHDFLGFAQKEAVDDQNILNNFKEVCKMLQDRGNKKCASKSIFSITSICKRSIKDEYDNVVKNVNKRLVDDFSLPPKKRVKNFSGDSRNTTEDKSSEQTLEKVSNNIASNDLSFGSEGTNHAFGGFTSASGKSLKVTDSSLRKAKSIFTDIDVDFPKSKSKSLTNINRTETLSKDNFVGFSSASGKSISVSNSSLKKAETIYNSIDNDVPKQHLQASKANKLLSHIDGDLDTPKNNFGGFSSASGKSIKVSQSSLKKAKNIFENLELGTFNEDNTSNLSDKIGLGGFSSASGKQIKVSENSMKKARDIFDNLDIEDFKENLGQVDTVSTSASNYKQEAIASKYIQSDAATSSKRFNNQNSIGTSSCSTGYRIAQGSSLKIPKVSNVGNTYKNEQKFNSVRSTGTLKGSIITKEDTKLKKRLGVSSCRQLQISDSKLDKAKLLFDEDLLKISPMRSKQGNVYISTPIKPSSFTTLNKFDEKPSTSAGHSSTPVRTALARPSRSFSSFLEGTAITPIKKDSTKVTADKSEYKDEFEGDETVVEKVDFCLGPESQVVVTSPTKGDVVEWINKLEEDRKQLEKKLDMVIERQRLLRSLRREKSNDEKRPREGILYRSKRTSPRIPLVCLMDSTKPEDTGLNCDLFAVTPDNATYVHFKEELSAVIHTKDGATVVPSLNDVIGVSEIETAFKAMPGTDPRLLPNGWIKNHYKWIVWKLASYARMFPSQFGGCLNVENVMQQLKYRYDREIDRAERSALRRIYEKDDVPQKRMVLCVSAIKKTMLPHELELTDGWYSIRTVIDEPLSSQVSKDKIKIGTKLMISGAELMNCDGCYPLETTSLTYLKISYNSTRRTQWAARLGYQHNPEPFVIKIETVHPSGGLLGAIKVCVVRAYPLCYSENVNGCIVWRNKKAEDRAVQQWENGRYKKLEEVEETIRNEFEISHKKQKSHSIKQHSVSDSTSPEILCDMLADGEDSDYNMQDMSPSQLAAIIDYKDKEARRKQEEIAQKINETVNKLQLNKRHVYPMLKVQVIDVNSDSNRGFYFKVERPSDTHIYLLREGAVVTVQNVRPCQRGELYTTKKTMFKPEPAVPLLYNDFRRRLTTLEEVSQKRYSPMFEEFDTVGLVVEVKAEETTQEAWLVDASGRLLLVYVTKGPRNCLIMDNLKRGYATTACNLVYRGLCHNDTVVLAMAGLSTVFSCYSQYRQLHEGLLSFQQQLPKDLDALLSDCDKKIESYRNSRNMNTRNSQTFLDDSDDYTLVSSKLTHTDVALSLIDVDTLN